MKPKKQIKEQQLKLHKTELEKIVDESHPLIRLSKQIDWSHFEKVFEVHYSPDKGRPGIPIRMMVGLHYLKYTYELSDEAVLEGWLENPYWQYFCGGQFFEHELPIDDSTMSRWRKKIGEEGTEEILSETIQTGIRTGAIKKPELKRVNVDTTVQTKAVRYPTDARLYDRMRERLVKCAGKEGIKLRQTYKRVGKRALQRQSGYGRAKQFKRARKQTKKLKTYLGRVVRDIERKAGTLKGELEELIVMAKRLLAQERNDKNKLYSIHAPEVECISKGKVHKKYEFGCKAGIVTTAKTNWIVGAKAFHGNPYDGHTLAEALEQTEKITNIELEQATMDMGYRGHKYEGKCKIEIVPRYKRGKSKSQRFWWKRRSAIEPIIGHMKEEHGLERNRLKGEEGDMTNVILSAAGFNMRKLLRAFLRLILKWLCGNANLLVTRLHAQTA